MEGVCCGSVCVYYYSVPYIHGCHVMLVSFCEGEEREREGEGKREIGRERGGGGGERERER